MDTIDIAADGLSAALLQISENEHVSMLDSCGVGHLGSHLIIAGIEPVEIVEVSDVDAERTLEIFEEKLSSGMAAVFTISYEFGNRLLNINGDVSGEPALFLALFDCLIVHDYSTGETRLVGNEEKFARVREKIQSAGFRTGVEISGVQAGSNFTRGEYIAAVERIKEHIRAGDTYQTNLTQQFTAECRSPQDVFGRLRLNHPAPFAAFITRVDSTVVSASPERFVRVEGRRRISASPIKGTRPRGNDERDDARLRRELIESEKDRAENTMIVDLLRNDIGRVCEFGSVAVEKLCDIEEHPTLFHLVSTVSGILRSDVSYADILRAIFPCGSITGAPKIRTMQLIEAIEPDPRGLSMGAIGYFLPAGMFDMEEIFDMSVAIRTMTVSGGKAVFNVGGGIVIDSDAEKEYEESLLKAKALLAALGAGKL